MVSASDAQPAEREPGPHRPQRHRGDHRRGARPRRGVPGGGGHRVGGCPYEGDVPAGRVLTWPAGAVAVARARSRCGDTTGMAVRGRVTELVGGFRSRHPGHWLNLHFHNTPAGWPPARAHVDELPDVRGQCRSSCSLRAGRVREHRHRGTGVHGGGHGCRYRSGPGRDDVGAAEEAERIVGRQLRPGTRPARAPGRWPVTAQDQAAQNKAAQNKAAQENQSTLASSAQPAQTAHPRTR